ncbi:unnamed protein product [Citrullus colocynthis]|uniref:Secreted protein n=1 Tax=Citrullus colocynthis TaxID=252529 RepID=A0ABP0YBN8_9ROSI
MNFFRLNLLSFALNLCRLMLLQNTSPGNETHKLCSNRLFEWEGKTGITLVGIHKTGVVVDEIVVVSARNACINFQIVKCGEIVS